MIDWDNSKNILPCYALIFVSRNTSIIKANHNTFATQEQQAGFLGFESITNKNGELHISYWQSQSDIDHWKSVVTTINSNDNISNNFDIHSPFICKVTSPKFFKRKD